MFGWLKKKREAEVVDRWVEPEPAEELRRVGVRTELLKEKWWQEFTDFVHGACDDDLEGLLRVRHQMDGVLASARDLADEMVKAFEERWPE